MRAAFASTLASIAAEDERVLLLTGDLGYKALEPFSERFPDRFFNVGVAEQNMMGLATGLAEAGFIPFCYSIATFASLRGYEFIRNGPIAHGLPVRIVGVGAGFDYGSAGPTHHGLEDVAVFRCQPGLRLLAPADGPQTASMLRATWALDGPSYYRIGKDDRVVVPGLEGRFALGRSEVVREGTDLLFLVTGSVAVEAVAAAEKLASDGVSTKIVVVSTLSPAPHDDLESHLRGHARCLTVEAHYAVGGLGSLVAELIAERGLTTRLRRLGVRERDAGRSGSAAYLLERHGLTGKSIAAAARGAFFAEPHAAS